MKSRSPFRKRLRRIRRAIAHALLVPVEVALVGIAAWAIPRLSRRRALALAHFVGGLAMRLSGRSNRVMAANLDLVLGPAADAEERRRFMRGVWDHSALVIVDCFWFLRDTHRRVTEWVEIDDTLKAVSRGTEGCATITAHLGNWELAAHAMCEHGRKLTSVFAPIGTPYTQKKLLASREMCGQHLVPKQGAVLNLLRCYRHRQIIGLLLDQFTNVTTGGMFVDILGVPAPISRIAGTIHARCGCAVLLKGGHRINDASDFLFADGCGQWFRGERIDNPNTHGTGCTLSSAIASFLAKGYNLADAVARAKAYLTGALAAMLDLGSGSGPMNHAYGILFSE